MDEINLLGVCSRNHSSVIESAEKWGCNGWPTPEEMLKCDLKLEMEALPDLKQAIEHSENVKDYVSRELFEHILESEEEHVDWLEEQFDRISHVGIKNYLQEMMLSGNSAG